MKKLSVFSLIVSFLFIFSCEDKVEKDTTPPLLTIVFPTSGSTVGEVVKIKVETSDDSGILKVDFYVPNTKVVSDTTSPYEYDWNTTSNEDGDYKIKVMSYDTKENFVESEVTVTIDNTLSVPTQINVSEVSYTISELTVKWTESTENDFSEYKLLYSITESGTKETLNTYTDKSITSYATSTFDPTHENWYWIEVTDTFGYSTIGEGNTNTIDVPPTSSVLYPITYNDGFQINWSQNTDDDFQSYKLYESLSEDMSNDTLIYETDNRTDTTYNKTLLNIRYYQIISEDVWALQSTSNIEVGDYNVELWGNDYSVLNTTELNLSNSGLTGEIPPEIGNLTNLERLYLHQNQLTGFIPQEIGNLTNLERLVLFNNQLTGFIPQEIGNLTNLEKLVLFNNQLTGSIPSEIYNLTNLTLLRLASNQLTGEIPESICDLNIDWSDENYFTLTNNQFCHPYPSCIENYVGDQDISNCDGVVELWGEYYSIDYTTELDLSNNQLTGSIPPEIGNLTNLTELDLSNNQLTGSIPPEIGNLTNLTKLILFNYYNNPGNLTGSIPPEIGNLTNLMVLALSHHQLTGSIPSEIGNLTNLETLYLNNNNLTGEIPEYICDLNLDWTQFTLTSNQFCPPYPSCIENYVGGQDTTNCD